MIPDRNGQARLSDRRLLHAKAISCVVGALIAISAASCGSTDTPSAPSPTSEVPSPSPVPQPTPPPTRVVTITASGVNPSVLVTSVGTRVTFVNNDVIPHDVLGGPDPSTPGCRELDAVGFHTPGQSRQTSTFEKAGTCEYHDHSFHSTLFNGRIQIQ